MKTILNFGLHITILHWPIFMKGKTKKAAGIIDKVLNKNPGNLHALCNLAVFLFYERQTEELESLLSALEKVQPMLFEHRYKLGATFALTERYEKAYFWLRQIQKYGYDGETGFYYWLAKAAYFTGNKKVAIQHGNNYRLMTRTRQQLSLGMKRHE